MALTVTHSKVSSVPDGTDTSVVRPSDWNANHSLSGVADLSQGGTGASTAPAAMANLMGFTTTATAAGSTTLTNTSTFQQVFTGTSTQTIVLPVTSTLTLGWAFEITNNSTGNLTVNSSGGNLVVTILPGTTASLVCILTSGTTAASWDYDINGFGAVTGTGSVVLSNSPTLVTPALGTPASGNLANCTFPTLNQNTTGTASNVTGTVAVANGGTGATTAAAALTNLGAAPLASPTFTGTPAAPTAAAGTNTTQLATTAYVTAAVAALIPSGTVALFAQAAAPTGWTQITTDTATNRMLRVVNTTGGGVGGSHSPILNNVVPSHTHGFTTGNMSADHSHSGWTGGVNSDHSHGQNVSANPGTGGPGIRQDYDADGSGYNSYFQGIYTLGQSNDHAHYITTGGASANHTHSGTTDNGSSQTNWTPRYVDILMCSKN